MKLVKVVAPTDLTVLIEGETGSGKEYIAKAIHYASARSKKPFVAVDCGAIPKDLANSELFGHIKGSFTGAINNKMGYFEQAKGGTLFLDEVGNLPYENQIKLLRALQERFINRVGDNKVIKVDVRIITASNEDLQNWLKPNEFREDLYHRLNAFKIPLATSERSRG
jgi:two-component system, NtrC family, response regulator HydG